MLKGTKVLIKSIETKDINILYNILSDEEVRKYDGAYIILPSRECIIENIDKIRNNNKVKYLSIVNEKNIVIGYLTYRQAQDAPNIYSLGITVGKKFWHRGYGQDSINTILKYLFLNRNAHRVELEVVELNKRAIKCYKKCGFKEEGIKKQRYFVEGKYIDVLIMAILKSEYMVND
ncbi:GNAT family N-acetyltransferase [Haloimpatiens sp. FM7330]|uniref:GNAT family N-acetyltransferase n=1 Tax=Haloimpatiens sp. FM7330 TaxID=3298610 RepID=UPI003626CAE1